nr:MAG TPA: hypothetical protein [Bacteriophage sp.]
MRVEHNFDILSVFTDSISQQNRIDYFGVSIEYFLE